MKKSLVLLAGAAMLSVLASCMTAPPVDASRQMLWERFGNQSIDNVLLAWGPPMAEARLTNGTRMITYTRTVIYEGGVRQNAYGCKASFLAPPPDYKVDNVSMDGNSYDCQELAFGRMGITVYPAPYPVFPYRPYYGY